MPPRPEEGRWHGLGVVKELNRGDPRVFGHDLSDSREFARCFARPPGTPVVVRGAASDWPALRKWRFAELQRRYGTTQFILEGETEEYQTVLRLDDFAWYCRNEGAHERNPMYVFDEYIGEDFHEARDMLQDYIAPVVCEDLFQSMDEFSRPDSRWLLIGPRRSGTFPHRDRLATSAWNATVVGAKRWVVLPPDVPQEAVFCRHGPGKGQDTYGWFENLDGVFAQLSPEQRARSADFVARAGDIVWMPAGWWHAVLNLSPWTVGVTENLLAVHDLDDGRRTLGEAALSALRKDEEAFELLEVALAGTGNEDLLQ